MSLACKMKVSTRCVAVCKAAFDCCRCLLCALCVGIVSAVEVLQKDTVKYACRQLVKVLQF
jgi:hypothetical protein